MSHYEVEIKSLLGSKENAEKLKQKMCELDPDCECVSSNNQLNHYFTGGDIHALFKKTQDLFDAAAKEKFKHMVEKGSAFSVRTRQMSTGDEKEVFLVVKASLDEGSSANTVTRLEFEEKVPVSLEALDALVEESGFAYQAKWSREREEYTYKGSNVCLDKNAGYGYLAEFEKVIEDQSLLESVRKELHGIMSELGVRELPQDRLERMFSYYNEHWPEYYGTEKTFTVE